MSHTGSLPTYTLQEVGKHRSHDDKWLIVDGQVYDISCWQYRHPGGSRVIGYFAGQDATDIVKALHPNWPLVKTYMDSIRVGSLSLTDGNTASAENERNIELERDFRELRQTLQQKGLFKADPVFYLVQLIQLLVLEILAHQLVRHGGASLWTFACTALLLTTSQIQIGWTQHDYGHSSVFASTKLNRFAHQVLMGHFKGASSHWWRFRHFQHHVRPNSPNKDPDIRHNLVFLVDKETASLYGTHRLGVMPYDWQHIYFWIIGPPALLTAYFQFENLYFMITWKKWLELLLTVSFFIRFFLCYVPHFGVFVTCLLYFVVRVLEGYWMVLVTQSNHIPMEYNHDGKPNRDFITAQCYATCNIEHSLFNDWFTGHVNFHIEHHLFPLMPRHNYVKAAPLVRELFARHDLPYVEKPLSTAIMDLVRTLKVCGDVWRKAYERSLHSKDENEQVCPEQGRKSFCDHLSQH